MESLWSKLGVLFRNFHSQKGHLLGQMEPLISTAFTEFVSYVDLAKSLLGTEKTDHV
jgi:hypothetical protein